MESLNIFLKRLLNENQKYTSASTSMNSKFLPKSSKMIDFTQYENGIGLDFGAGKFNNYIEYLSENFNITLYAYDKFNRSETENNIAFSQSKYDFVMCNNVLNVIEEDSVISSITGQISEFKCDAYYLIYEGDKSGDGKVTRKDSYQRNAIAKSYLKFIPKDVYSEVKLYRNMIICKF